MTRTREAANHPRRYAGKIHPLDFNTEYPTYPGDIASRIISDLRFDQQCMQNETLRELKKHHTAKTEREA